MKFQTSIKHTILLVCAIMLTACGTQLPATATPDISTTLSAARTDAAAIVSTQIASQATPTLVPSSTLAPSATTLPSDTPAASMTPVAQVTATKTPLPTARLTLYTVTPRNYNCSITSTSPDGATMKARNDFDAHWVVKNTGTQTWNTQDYDYKYVSGEKMHQHDDTYNMKSDVSAGNSVDIIVDMLAPDKSGNYEAVWAIVTGSTTVCTMTVDITVK